MLLDREHAGVGLGGVGPAAGLDVPVEDAADERRDQERLGVGAGDRLGEREDQRQVAVDALGCNTAAACAPSQVAAILMRMRSRPMPRLS